MSEPERGLSMRERIEEITAGIRDRNARSVFLLGRPVARDRFLSGLYFGLKVNTWHRHAQHEGHLSGFEAGLEKLEGPPRRVLDICTGTGSSAALLAERYPDADVTAVDISRRMVNRATRTHRSPRLRFMRGDVLELPFESDTFDLVTCLNGLFWPPEIRRVSAPGARLMLAATFVPPSEEPSAWLDRWRDSGFERIEHSSVLDGGFEIFEFTD